MFFHVSRGFHDIEISTVNCQSNTSLCRSVNWSGAAVDQFMVLPSAISPYFLLTPYFVCLRAELFMQKWLLLLPYNVKIQFSGKWFLPFFMMNYYNGVKTPILFCIHRTKNGILEKWRMFFDERPGLGVESQMEVSSWRLVL